jgi:hypothetical protein
MGKTGAIEKRPAKTTTIQARREQRDREFRDRFGHPYDLKGYRGHTFYGYNCQNCGIHISLVGTKRWLKSECKGNFPGLKLPS